MAAHDTNRSIDAERDDRISTLGWGLLFIVVGGVALVPGLPKDAWLIAAGAVMLGVSAARVWLRLPVHGVTVVVSAVALTAGSGSVAGLATATGPLVLIVLGLALIVRALYRAQKTDVASLSGSTEGGR